MAIFKVGDRVRIVSTEESGRILSIQPSPELDTLEESDPAFHRYRGYAVQLDRGSTKVLMGMDLEPIKEPQK